MKFGMQEKNTPKLGMDMAAPQNLKLENVAGLHGQLILPVFQKQTAMISPVCYCVFICSCSCVSRLFCVFIVY